MGVLLLGDRRIRRTAPEEQPGQFPGGEIYLSFPGLGDRLAARVAGEIGDHIEQFDSPNALACYAGKAPVTRRSGKSEYVVACRLACNRHLRDAVQLWAYCSLTRSTWAREFYDRHVADHHSHNAALRVGEPLAGSVVALFVSRGAIRRGAAYRQPQRGHDPPASGLTTPRPSSIAAKPAAARKAVPQRPSQG